MFSLPWLLGKDEVLEHFMHDSVTFLLKKKKKDFWVSERKYLNNLHFFKDTDLLFYAFHKLFYLLWKLFRYILLLW